MANYADLTSQGTEKYTSPSLENAKQVTTTQSILFGLDGRNTDGANGIYIQVWDSNNAGGAGSTLAVCIGVPPAGSGATIANGNFGYTDPVYGIKFTKGIWVVASSTDAPTATAVATSKTFFHVQYSHEDGINAL